MPEQTTALYQRVLGARFEALPAKIRDLHDVTAPMSAAGLCEIRRGDGLLSRALGALFALPPAGRDIPVTVTFEPSAAGEVWRRRFGAVGLRTSQHPDGARPGHLIERYGPMALRLELRLCPDGLDLILCRAWLFGLPLPRALWPRIEASERAHQGLFVFDVRLALPLAGLLIHYRGWLKPGVHFD